MSSDCWNVPPILLLVLYSTIKSRRNCSFNAKMSSAFENISDRPSGVVRVEHKQGIYITAVQKYVAFACDGVLL